MSREIGEKLRAEIRKWLRNERVSARELSRRIGRDPNYVTSYLGRPADKWSVPKHPTLPNLLQAIGINEHDLVGKKPDVVGG